MTKITERGMIFNAEMVRAILDGRKTQTRRPIKWKQTRFTEIGEREDGSKWPWSEDAEHAFDFWHPCPFGSVGDRIWVRETFQGPLFDFDLMDSYCKDSTPFEKSEFCVYKADGVPAPEFYDADDELHSCWRPSIHLSLIHISEPTRLGMISYAVFCLKKKKKKKREKKKKKTEHTRRTPI